MNKFVSTIILFLILSTMVAGCINNGEIERKPQSSITPTPTPMPTATPTPTPIYSPYFSSGLPNGLDFGVKAEKDTYYPNETVRIFVSFINRGNETLYVYPFPPKIVIHSRIDWNIKKTMEPGDGSAVLKPNETASTVIEWDMTFDNGMRAPPGEYSVEMKDVKSDNHGLYVSSFCCAKFVILNPHGNLVGSAFLNITQTANGRAITLKKVEFKSDEALFYVLTDAKAERENDPNAPPIPIPSDKVESFSAKLRVGGVELPVRPYGYKVENGKWLVMFTSPPIPSNVSNISLTVIQNEKWTFEISKDSISLQLKQN